VITLIPFAKSVSGGDISNTKGAVQPTNQIVDFYVETIANSGPGDYDPAINNGRYQAKFRINFEDVENGADHDMDAIVEYEIKANSDNTLDVKLTPIYEAGGIQHRMGYIISGSTKDGIHLVVQDENDQTPYFLNVPPGESPGFCDTTPVPAKCNRLPFLGATAPDANFNLSKFSPSTSAAATFLKDPLWYAAKWGGFVDNNSNGIPDQTNEWDKDGDGVPDTYFFVQNPSKLKESLKNAFEAIVERNGSSSNIATNSSRLNSSSQIYQASFTAGKWSGDVAAYPITKLGISNTPVWNANNLIPQWDLRNIYMNTSSGVVDTKATGYSALPAADQTALVSEDVYKYIRGDVSKELTRPGGTLRTRDGILGDIIHSSPNFDPDTGNIYVGANDGMFHAFSNTTGIEKYAFIPYQAQAKLKNLSATNYSTSHDYFVDGDVSIAFKTTQTANTKYLYSLLGRGGKGLFSANATATAMSLLWEYTPAANTDAAADKDLGLMLGRPVFTLLNNGKAALMVGNGYNSTDGKAVLYIFIINTDGTLDSVKKIDTGVAGDNGLSGPAFVDNNNDGKADYVYAGDLKGNLWKFDISSASPSAWGVAFSNTPLFKAVSPGTTPSGGQPQPITAPLYIAKNAVTGDPNFGKYFIFFGTGSYFQTGDATNLQVQSWYGIVDDISTIAGRNNLTKRTISSQATVAGKDVRFFSKAIAGDMAGKRGWYMDLKDGTNLGERIVTRSQIIPAIVPALLVSSLYPVTGDVCVPGGDGFINFVNPFSGGAIETGIIDVNGDGKFDGSDQNGNLVASSIKGYVGIPTTPIFISSNGSSNSGLANPLSLTTSENNRYFDGNGRDVTAKETECANAGQVAYGGSDGRNSIGFKCPTGTGNLKGRISWREILKD
jgi:type IV pilus assembly protein PilY1